MKYKGRAAFSVAALLCVFVSVCGCKNTSPNAQDGTQPHAAYAVILPSDGDEAMERMRAGVEAEAARQGSTVDIFYTDNAQDTDGLHELPGFCAKQGYRSLGIALPLADADGAGSISAAAKQGMPIVLFGASTDFTNSAMHADGVFAVVTVDAVKLGELGANYIVSKCTAGGTVAILAESVSDAPQQQGAEAVLRAATGLQLLESAPLTDASSTLQERAEQLIRANPKLTAIYCCSRRASLEASRVAENEGRDGEIWIVGTDSAESAYKKNGNTATVAIDYQEIGAAAFRKMYEATAQTDLPAETETVYAEPYILQ